MRGRALVVVIALLAAGTVGAAGVQYSPGNAVEMPAAIVTDGPAWGTTALSKVTIGSWEFVPISSQVTYSFSYSPTSIYRTNASGDAWFEAPFHLQSGALITQFEVQFCDLSATLEFDSFFMVHTMSTGNRAVTNLVSSAPPAATPGCVVQTATLAQPVTVDNNDNFYTVEINLGGTSDVRIGAVKVGYKLQVSPAPATATFTDVSTGYWAFRHIEALAASGITTGCGGGNYCPEATVTRAEVAVFLAKALGLHWAP